MKLIVDQNVHSKEFTRELGVNVGIGGCKPPQPIPA